MHLYYRNVNDAFRGLVTMFQARELSDGSPWPLIGNKAPIAESPSRNGRVLYVQEPVTITYDKPLERVLFNAARDANPFFHLYESLWMLAGRNDVAPLAYYAKQMQRYSDDGKTLNGAYGYRWRKWEWNRPQMEHMDQLEYVIEHLRGEPHSRRTVLQMWSPEHDLLNVGYKRAQFGHYQDWPASKDVCCNLSVMFSVRWGAHEGCAGATCTYCEEGRLLFLDMTVTNRSNDTIWGTLGANYVHFTFLQEYMAARLGVEVGKYHQFSNNLHVYDEPDDDNVPKWQPEKWLAEYEGVKGNHGYDGYTAEGGIELRNKVPLVKDPAAFDAELPAFVEQYSGPCLDKKRFLWSEPFFTGVAAPAFRAFAHHKAKDTTQALRSCESIAADDWRIACQAWLQRRIK